MSQRSAGVAPTLGMAVESRHPARDASRVRILIVGDVRLYREALTLRLGQSASVTVVGAVECRDADRDIARLAPDLVLLDAGEWGGLDLAKTLLAQRPDLSIVAVAVPEFAGRAIAAMWRGIAGYVPRSGSIEDVMSVVEGLMVCERAPSVAVLERGNSLNGGHGARPPATPDLTRREDEILELIEIGLSNKEIARNLRIELGTVKNHVHNILEKLNVKGRNEAAHQMRKHRSA